MCKECAGRGSIVNCGCEWAWSEYSLQLDSSGIEQGCSLIQRREQKGPCGWYDMGRLGNAVLTVLVTCFLQRGKCFLTGQYGRRILAKDWNLQKHPPVYVWNYKFHSQQHCFNLAVHNWKTFCVVSKTLHWFLSSFSGTPKFTQQLTVS